MRPLTPLLFIALLTACGGASTGDHTILLDATQSEWLESNMKDRKATAKFWTWEFAGKPKTDDKGHVKKASENLLSCINKVEVLDPNLTAKATARVCWSMLSSL